MTPLTAVLRLRELRERLPEVVLSTKDSKRGFVVDGRAVDFLVEAIDALPSLLDAVEGGRAEGLEEAARALVAENEKALNAMRGALLTAAQLTRICSDWNLDHVEVEVPDEFVKEGERDGSLVSIHAVRRYFEARLRTVAQSEAALSGESQREEKRGTQD